MSTDRTRWSRALRFRVNHRAGRRPRPVGLREMGLLTLPRPGPPAIVPLPPPFLDSLHPTRLVPPEKILLPWSAVGGHSMKPAFAAGPALTLAMMPGCHRPPAGALAADGLTPVPAARYIVAAFARYPVVAFSRAAAWAGGTKAFFASLIREPGFAGTIQDLVIECGIARYQDVVDRRLTSRKPARLARSPHAGRGGLGAGQAPNHATALGSLVERSQAAGAGPTRSWRRRVSCPRRCQCR